MNVLWMPNALADRVEIYDYIERQSHKNAIQVDDELLRFVDFLRESPEMGRIGKLKGTRELVIGKTGYIAYYRIRKEQVEILNVLRATRRPPVRTKL